VVISAGEIRLRSIAWEKSRRAAFASRRGEEHVDDLAELVDGPEQVSSRPSDLQVGLIDSPAIPDHVATDARGPDVVDVDPTLGQELFDVAVGQTEPQVPPDRQGDDLWREAEPGEG
jgi:hypothetical protein